MENPKTHLREFVMRTVAETPLIDIHTHLYAPAFGDLVLQGIDDLLVFHYLVSEGFRQTELPYADFWALPKSGQAEIVWQTLFEEHSPLSEAARGVITTLNRLGLDPNLRDLPALRNWFATWWPNDYINHCMQIAHVDKICMTNSPFDSAERAVWETYRGDSRFAAALRIDPLLVDTDNAMAALAEQGYRTRSDFGGETYAEVRRFLGDWRDRMDALYIMASLPPDFAFPNDSAGSRILESAILPYCRETGTPLAFMLGVRRQVNPELHLAGDGIGRSDLAPLAHLCAGYPDVKFLVTVLARECQQELCVIARKFRNLHPFGCWWFMNVPSLIEEVTRMRVELLGTSFTAQHSDSRVVDQLIYKWDHSRAIVGRVLADKYADLYDSGWIATEDEIRRDVRELLGGSFQRFIGK